MLTSGQFHAAVGAKAPEPVYEPKPEADVRAALDPGALDPAEGTWPWYQIGNPKHQALSVLDGFGNGAFVIRDGDRRNTYVTSR